jgi:hypothetical protein
VFNRVLALPVRYTKLSGVSTATLVWHIYDFVDLGNLHKYPLRGFTNKLRCYGELGTFITRS